MRITKMKLLNQSKPCSAVELGQSYAGMEQDYGWVGIDVEFDNKIKKRFAIGDELRKYMRKHHVFGLLDDNYAITTSDLAYKLYEVIDFFDAVRYEMDEEDEGSVATDLYLVSKSGLFELDSNDLVTLEEVLFTEDYLKSIYISEDMVRIDCMDDDGFLGIKYKILDYDKYKEIVAEARKAGYVYQ